MGLKCEPSSEPLQISAKQLPYEDEAELDLPTIVLAIAAAKFGERIAYLSHTAGYNPRFKSKLAHRKLTFRPFLHRAREDLLGPT